MANSLRRRLQYKTGLCLNYPLKRKKITCILWARAFCGGCHHAGAMLPLLKDLAAGWSTAKNMKVIEEIEFLKTQIKRLEQLANNKDSGLELNDEINVDRKKNGSIVYYTNKLNGNNMVVTI